MILALFYIIHVVVSLFLIGVVLLQQGKGADLSVFGGGSTMTAFGARSATNILHKMTVASFVAFIITTLTIGVLQRGSRGSTVMDDVAATEAPAEAAATADDTSDGSGVPSADGAGENADDTGTTDGDAPATDVAPPADAAATDDPGTDG